ncbi:HlyD family secretion protein [Amphritea balenae]|uniref:HlyD family efflux transporter periplasmic adaptor subunit n=1 Tax=Amphritea balenae TaxID=452629 RepID=A0A3P1SL23_9GAMM|nr:HlyD family secretion protein [Amphritea balenae]RRC97629.1 HlyD family efflux transporter periplasmic adaptor subunit [Amphritea balenae]GGK73563.1 hemolysin D [Amphritea balenae]
MALPPLRDDLSIHQAPAATDGSPTWSLHDPTRSKFFRIDWATFLIISNWELGDPELICAAIQKHAPLDIVPDDIDKVIEFLAAQELIQCVSATDSARLTEAVDRQQQVWWKWLLHHYLFFRLPLFRPNDFLQHMLPAVEIFYSKAFRIITLIAFVMGLFGISRQWSEFSTTLVDTFTWDGLTSYMITLVLVKVLHEFGHAFTAKRYGCNVPTMGVAFLVMFPVAYTDVNDGWKLENRFHRLAIGAGGIAVELALASWALLMWSLLPEGNLRDSAFFIATTSIISSILINASPFLRFDGYFLLSDWLNVANLHNRAGALAKWRMREWLFDLGDMKPEVFSKERERFMTWFAFITWLYRLVLFLGIAVMVYEFFFKALGIILFVVELLWFIAFPVFKELKEWYLRWPEIRQRRRHIRSMIMLVILIIVGFLPLNFRINGQAVLEPVNSFTLYAPAPAQLMAELPPSGSELAAGDLLLKLQSPVLEQRELLTIAELTTVAWQRQAAALDMQMRPQLPLFEKQLAEVNSKLNGIRQEKKLLKPVAPFTGQLVDPMPDLRVGDWIQKDAAIATLIDPAHWQVETYLGESDISRIKQGDSALFYAETPGSDPLVLKVVNIDRDSSRVLQEPMLASVNGGSISVRPQKETLIPEQAIYRVVLSVENPETELVQVQRGQVMISGEAESVLGYYLTTALSVLIRESSW